jgi:hypothetical protein
MSIICKHRKLHHFPNYKARKRVESDVFPPISDLTPITRDMSLHLEQARDLDT